MYHNFIINNLEYYFSSHKNNFEKRIQMEQVKYISTFYAY